MKRKAGRPPVDGAKDVSARINLSLTQEHKEKLIKLSNGDASAWVRKAIEIAHQKLKAGK
ncbi:hypothetical protein [Polynucleobacter sp. UK-Kesae-W10]|uniref:hypothetical protein n=1 Tax=Polynucleobacter sp. UK-Kesae-W10 TaxID=1819738 RepID=UPI001C0B7C81|nr:hypothetical protein [Polynucleobacter sp. UK-Kesae-W10]MBU3577538.1 hypothetical protein [Polynucleobacter sp. UK-Kesae-W10]